MGRPFAHYSHFYFSFYRAKYPDHEFIGEEGTASRDGSIPKFSNKPTWIIDPIDGTMNFVHSNPNVSVSVALAVNRRVEIGIISLPATQQLYTARKGQGAQFNGSPVKVRATRLVLGRFVRRETNSSNRWPAGPNPHIRYPIATS